LNRQLKFEIFNGKHFWRKLYNFVECRRQKINIIPPTITSSIWFFPMKTKTSPGTCNKRKTVINKYHRPWLREQKLLIQNGFFDRQNVFVWSMLTKQKKNFWSHTQKRLKKFESNKLTFSLKNSRFTTHNLSDLFSLITGQLSHHKIYEIRQIKSQFFDKTKTFSAS